MPENVTLLTVKEVAERVALSEWAIRRAIHDGQLPAYKPRGQLRVDAGELERWLHGTRVSPAARTERETVALTPSPSYPESGSFRARTRRRETA